MSMNERDLSLSTVKNTARNSLKTGCSLHPISLNELSTTPDNQHGEHCFTLTHPFHPLSGQTFPLLAQSYAGEKSGSSSPIHRRTRCALCPWLRQVSPSLTPFWLLPVAMWCYVL